MDYLEAVFIFPPGQESLSGILTAELAEIGFDTFEETDEGLKAYIPSVNYKADALQKVLDRYNLHTPLKVDFNLIPHQNWNALWESNFNPVVINNECLIRAPFHPIDENMNYDIVVEPKMAFGTGHHETTFLMASSILKLDLQGKSVIDMGCGTGVLAILSAMKGADPVYAIDIDPIAVKSAEENAIINDQPQIRIAAGDASLLKDFQADVLLANINRNILLKDLPAYENTLKANGVLLLSGFYTVDLESIRIKAESLDLQFVEHQSKNNWVAARFEKKAP